MKRYSVFARLTIVLILLFVSCHTYAEGTHSNLIDKKKTLKVSKLDEVKISDLGLYFAGKKDIDYRFSSRISPHGDCIETLGSYVFFTWYKGGMDKRNLMLSRMKIGSGKWVSIEFPDRLIGFRGDSTKGDSHNTAAVGICEIDNTIHLLYDMHVYSKTNCPSHAFNYRVSVENAATVPDSLWNLKLFHAKRNYLKAGMNYENITYPEFTTIDKGKLLVKFRIGGAGNGDNIMVEYDGDSWSDNIRFNNGNQADKSDMYSIYGGFQYLHGYLYSGFSVRYAYREDKYVHNNGFYFAAFKDGSWHNASHEQVKLPIEKPDVLKIGEPCDLGLGYKLSGGTNWTITENGAVHFMILISGTSVHYYKSPEETSFSHASNSPYGEFFSIGKYVCVVGLDDGHIKISAAMEGTDNWVDLYQDKSGKTFRHFNIAYENNQLFVYSMEDKSGDTQPLYLSTFEIKFKQ